jgi:hypothetical protein
MQEVSNSLNPYEHFSKNLNYTFTTSNGIEYFVYFTETSGYFEHIPEINDDIVTFGFYPLTDESEGFFYDPKTGIKRKQRFDMRVSDTIGSIIQEFLFTYPYKCPSFLCDDTDRRDKCRQKLFRKWAQSFSRFIEMPSTVYENQIYDKRTIYGDAGIIVRNDHPRHALIRDSFMNLSSVLVGKDL